MRDAYRVADAEANPAAYLPNEENPEGIPHFSRELDTLFKIDRFGVRAILGRDVLYYGELQRMIMAEKIYRGYKARAQAQKGDGWTAWNEQNPWLARTLIELEKDNS